MSKQINFINLTQEYQYAYSFNLSDLKVLWNAVHCDNVYLSNAYLTAIANTQTNGLSYVYVVLFRNKIPVGILYYQKIEIDAEFFKQKKFPNKINNNITSQILKNIKGSLLLSGNFFATGDNGFCFKENVPETFLHLITESLTKRICSTIPVVNVNYLMYKEFWKSKNENFQTELKKHTATLEIDVNMVLEHIDQWNSFSDYLDAMKTKYRTRAKSVLKKTEVLIVKQLSADEILSDIDTIKQLYNSVINTAGFTMLHFDVNGFSALKKELQNQFIFTAYYKENKMVAFSTAIKNNNILEANYVGIDYDTNKEIPLYQKILYDYVALAINTQNIKELSLGRTAEIMKSSLGAIPKEMNLYIKHRNNVMHKILKPLTTYVGPSQYEIRKPFKN